MALITDKASHEQIINPTYVAVDKMHKELIECGMITISRKFLRPPHFQAHDILNCFEHNHIDPTYEAKEEMLLVLYAIFFNIQFPNEQQKKKAQEKILAYLSKLFSIDASFSIEDMNEIGIMIQGKWSMESIQEHLRARKEKK